MEIAWRTIAKDVFQLTEETEANPATYRLTVVPTDINDPGATEPIEIGFCVIDYVGYMFPVISVNGNVIDAFRTQWGPQIENNAIVYKTVANGDAPYLAQIIYTHLHECALDQVRKVELDILWKRLYDEAYSLDPAQWKRNAINSLVKFGVAIGTDNNINGNESYALGTGGTTRSFRETVQGSYPKDTPAISSEMWFALDLIWSLGNGIERGYEHNAIEVYKSGLVKFYNALLIGAYSHLEVSPINGMIQYTALNGFEKWVDTEWVAFGGGASSYIELTDTSDTTYTDKDMFVPMVNEATGELDLTETEELVGVTGTVPSGSTMVFENGILKSYT
jgi:hypothetical protein